MSLNYPKAPATKADIRGLQAQIDELRKRLDMQPALWAAVCGECSDGLTTPDYYDGWLWKDRHEKMTGHQVLFDAGDE